MFIEIPPAKVEVAVVEVAFTNPNVGEEEAVKKCSVPEEVMTSGPWAVKVCVAPERPFNEVIPPPPVPAQVPEESSKHPPDNRIPLANVEVADEVLISEPPVIVSPLEEEKPAAANPSATVEVPVLPASSKY